MELEFRPGIPQDSTAIAVIHRASFPGFFLTHLGTRFLAQYYRAIADHPRGILLVAGRDGQVSGFVAGFDDATGFFGLLRRRWLAVGLSMVPGLIRRPWLILRTARTALRAGSDPLQPGDAELTSVGVAPALQGRGVGADLVRAFCNEAGSRGCRRVRLHTDANDNANVNRFYQRLGFKLAGTTTQESGRLIHTYVVSLAAPSGSPAPSAASQP